MEPLDVKAFAEGRAGLLPQAKDLDLTRFLSKRLAGHADVTIDLGLDRLRIDGGPLLQVRDCLASVPSKCVDSCVDDQAAG